MDKKRRNEDIESLPLARDDNSVCVCVCVREREREREREGDPGGAADVGGYVTETIGTDGGKLQPWGQHAAGFKLGTLFIEDYVPRTIKF